MAANNDPGLVHKALAKAQSVESRLNQLIAGMSPEAPSIVYNQNTTVVTTNTAQTTTFTVPPGVTSIQVECWGAGAGAGGGSTGEGGEGGGGGEYACEPNYPVTPGQVLSYTVGGGGTGGSTGNRGTGGGDTFFDFPGSSAGGVYAYGGSPGSAFTGGIGGGGSPNTIGFAGGAGGNSAANGNNGGSPGAGGGGCGAATGVTSLHKSYNAIITRSWYGSDATGNPNATRNTNGAMYQGGETASGGTYNGNQKSACLFDTQQIQADFAGYTMNSCSLTIHNLHSWYSSMTVQFNEWNVNTLPSSLPSSWNGTGGFFITSGNILEGTTHTYSFNSTLAGQFISGLTIGFAFTPGGGNYNLNYYGYFSGASNPVLQLAGTIGGSPVTAGNGADGQVRITYATPSTIVAAVQPAAGTDANGNNFTAGVSAQGVMQYAVATPAAPPSGTALQYATTNGTPSYITADGYVGQLPGTQSDSNTFTASSGSFTQLSAQYKIKQGDPNVGTCYRLKVYGTANVTSGDAYNIVGFIGGSQQGAGGFNGPATSSSFYWNCEYVIMFTAVGTSGTLLANCNGSVSFGTRGASSSSTTWSDGTSSTVAVNTTTGGDITVELLGSVAAGSLTSYFSTFERIGA